MKKRGVKNNYRAYIINLHDSPTLFLYNGIFACYSFCREKIMIKS